MSNDSKLRSHGAPGAVVTLMVLWICVSTVLIFLIAHSHWLISIVVIILLVLVVRGKK